MFVSKCYKTYLVSISLQFKCFIFERKLKKTILTSFIDYMLKFSNKMTPGIMFKKMLPYVKASLSTIGLVLRDTGEYR